MKILILSDRIPPENRGGAGIVAWNLACGFRDLGHEVHVIAATENNAFEDIRNGIYTYHLHSQYPERFHAYFSVYNPQTVQHLKKLYKQIQPDIINAHNIHSHLSYHCLTLAHQMEIPAIFSSHDMMPVAYQKLNHFVNPNNCEVEPESYQLPAFHNLKTMRFRYNPLRNIVIKHVLSKHVVARTTPSRELAIALAANGLPSFQTVHNGVDSTRYDISQDKVELIGQKLKLEGRKIILFAGRLTEGKGMFQALAMMQKLVQQLPEALLLVLSSHEIERQIKQAEYRPLLHQFIKSGGWLDGDELAAATKLADVVMVPSVYLDPFPNMNLEGMAASNPVITTCYGGSKEAIIDGETGYVINPHDIDNFTAKVHRLLTDHELNQKMGQAGKQRIREHFTLEHQLHTMLAIFQNHLVE